MPSRKLWLEETELPFSRAERSAVFYQSGVDCIFPCGPKPIFLSVYDMLYSGFFVAGT